MTQNLNANTNYVEKRVPAEGQKFFFVSNLTGQISAINTPEHSSSLKEDKSTSTVVQKNCKFFNH